MNKKKDSPRIVEIVNKKASRNYDITETIEAGIVLFGPEVKSLRNGKGDISDAYCHPKNKELFVINLRIEPYFNASIFNQDPLRTRKLLLHKKEIVKLAMKIKEKQLTLVPLKIYFSKTGKVKILLGLGKGKKLYDKREDEKKREADREIAQGLKNRNRI